MGPGFPSLFLSSLYLSLNFLIKLEDGIKMKEDSDLAMVVVGVPQSIDSWRL